jgi:hypothetical protein
MPKYVIERTIPGAGKLSPKDLVGVSTKSNAILRELGSDVQWVHSYVTDDKVYCVYIAKNPEIVREHAKRGGLPVDAVNEVRTIIDPTSAESR